MLELLKFLGLLCIPIGMVLFIAFVIVPWSFKSSQTTKKYNLSDDDIVTLLTVQQFLRQTKDDVAKKLANDIDKILEEHIC